MLGVSIDVPIDVSEILHADKFVDKSMGGWVCGWGRVKLVSLVLVMVY
jgi:hypothetical protein